MKEQVVTVLLVEDNSGDFHFIENLLAESKSDLSPSNKFHLTRAIRLSDALEKVKQNDFDLVILDLSLPDAVGLEALQRLRAEVPYVPIIVLTGNTNDEVALASLRAGAQDFLVKSELDRDVLTRTIRYASERKRSEALQTGQQRVLELLSTGAELEVVLHELVLTIESQSADMICSVLLLDEEKRTLTHAAGPNLPRDYVAIINKLPIGPNEGSCGTAAHLGMRVIVENIALSPLWTHYKEIALRHNLFACWSQPITTVKGAVLGTFAMYYETPHTPGPAEIATIERAAYLAGLAIERKRFENRLTFRIRLEQLITQISTHFINLPTSKISDEIQHSLQSIGEFAGVDRSYIFEFSEDGIEMSNTHEWCKEGISSDKSDLQNIPTAHFPWWMAQLTQTEAIHFSDISELPPEAAAERAQFLTSGIRSLVAVPMIYAGTTVGFLGFDAVEGKKSWTQGSIALLKMTAQIFINAMMRLKTELELNQSREQLRQSEAQLRLTFDNAPIGIVTMALSGRFLSVNHAFASLVEYSIDELEGMLENEITHPDDNERYHDYLGRLLSGDFQKFSLEKRYVRKDSSVVTCSIQVGLVRGGTGEPVHFVAQIEDLSDKQKWEEEYLRSSKLESLGILAGGIAHDFNNLLMAILGSTAIAKLQSRQNEEVFRRLSEVEKASLRARDLTQQLLTFAKGGAPIKKITSISDVVVETVQFALHGGSVTAEYDFPKDLWSVELDEGQMSQVFNNLTINAIQAMPEGGRIVIRAHNIDATVLPCQDPYIDSPGRYLKLSFSDSGLGIPPDLLPKIFDPYFSTKDTGTGLGLATTHSIIRKHQGHVFVESKLGIGTTFHIYLPAILHALAERVESTPNIISGEGKILVMDDEQIVRETAEDMLEFLGYDVWGAENGERALELYLEHSKLGVPFDALILDLTIPGGMGGKRLLETLLSYDPTTVAIASSGYSDDRIMANYSQYGFRAVVPKPYDFHELSTALRTALASKTITPFLKPDRPSNDSRGEDSVRVVRLRGASVE